MSLRIIIVIVLVILVVVLCLLMMRGSSLSFKPKNKPEEEMDALSANPTPKQEIDYLESAQKMLDQQRIEDAILELKIGARKQPDNDAISLKLLNVYALINKRDEFDTLFNRIAVHSDAHTVEQAKKIKSLMDEEAELVAAPPAQPNESSRSYSQKTAVAPAPSAHQANTTPPADTNTANSASLAFADLEADTVQEPAAPIITPQSDTPATNTVAVGAAQNTEVVDLEPTAEADVSVDEPLIYEQITEEVLNPALEGDLAFDENDWNKSELAESAPAQSESVAQNIPANDTDGLDFTATDSAFANESDLSTEATNNKWQIEPEALDDALESDAIEFDLTELEQSFEKPNDTEAALLANQPTETTATNQAMDFDWGDELSTNTETPAVETDDDAIDIDDFEIDVDDLNLDEPERDTLEVDDIQADSTSADRTEPQSPTLGAADATTTDTVKLTEASDTTTVTPVVAPAETTDSAANSEMQAFDFIKELDNSQLTLDLAQQYLEVGEYDSAKRLVKEVIAGDGTEEQKLAAQAMLSRLY